MPARCYLSKACKPLILNQTPRPPDVNPVFHALVQQTARSSASPARHGPRARESSVIVIADRVSGLSPASRSPPWAKRFAYACGVFRSRCRRAAVGPAHAQSALCISDALPGRAAFGLVSAYVARRRGTEVDPIEANALHGGRMSMRGSLIVAAQTVWSSGVGASVGLEAGYTQLASGIASQASARLPSAPQRHAHPGRLRRGRGHRRRLRRAARPAPFTVSSLIIGSYSIASLAPVGMAALFGYLTAQIFARRPARHRNRRGLRAVAVHDVVIAGGVGLLAAVLRHHADARRRRLRDVFLAAAGASRPCGQ